MSMTESQFLYISVGSHINAAESGDPMKILRVDPEVIGTPVGFLKSIVLPANRCPRFPQVREQYEVSHSRLRCLCQAGGERGSNVGG